MRTLEQCREEIFLRSRQRIRRHKKIRWAVGAACVPLALTAVLLFPFSSPKNSERPTAEAMPDGSPPISAMGDVTVSVQLPGAQDVILAEGKLAAQLAGCFVTEEAVTEPPKESPESAPLTGGEMYGDRGDNYSPAPIFITCRQVGRELTYILTGNQLTCEQSGETVTLSDEERSRLEAYWTVE